MLMHAVLTGLRRQIAETFAGLLWCEAGFVHRARIGARGLPIPYRSGKLDAWD